MTKNINQNLEWCTCTKLKEFLRKHRKNMIETSHAILEGILFNF